MQHSWGSLMRLAQDKQKLRNFVDALDPTGLGVQAQERKVCSDDDS